MSHEIPSSDVGRYEARIRQIVAARGGKWTARSSAAILKDEYRSLDSAGRMTLFHALERVVSSSAVLAADNGRGAGLPPPLNLLELLNNGDDGTRFIVQLRTDLLNSKQPQKFPVLHRELLRIVENIFDFGFLKFRPITWEMPAEILEKLFAYEAVHKIDGWDDLKRRLSPPQQCFGLFHAAMGSDPLIFVEIAFTRGVARRISDLIAPDAATLNPDCADTAMFYSISNTHKGLIGVKFGDYLLKCAFAHLSPRYPNLKRFVTLSPIPGFRNWLAAMLRSGEADDDIRQLCCVTHGDPFFDGWTGNEDHMVALNPILLKLCARYLVRERSGHEAADPVAEFHFGNGCKVDRINWMADPSSRGLSRSAGIMVNYDYTAEKISERYERYVTSQVVDVSNEVERLLGETMTTR